MKLARYSVKTSAADPNFPTGTSPYCEDLRTVYEIDALLNAALKAIPVTARESINDAELRDYWQKCDSAIAALTNKVKAAETAVTLLEAQTNPSAPKKTISAAKSTLAQERKELATAKDTRKVTPTKPVTLHDVTIGYRRILYTEGSQYLLIRSDGKNITNHKAVVQAAMDAIDSALQRWFYVITDKGNPVYSWDTHGVKSVAPIFDNLVRLNVIDGVDIVNSSLDCAYAMKLLKKGSDKNVMTNWQWPNYKDDLTAPWIWIPKKCFINLCDCNEDGATTCYTWDSAGKRYSSVTPVPKKELPYYRVDGSKASCTTEPTLVKLLNGERSGGGGPMRADPVSEIAYSWTAAPGMGQLIAKAIRLDATPSLAPAALASYVPAPVIASAFGKQAGSPSVPLLTYASKFLDPVTNKRNLPKSTFPLAIPTFNKNDDARGFKTVALRKSRKGEWLFNAGAAHTGESLVHRSIAPRLNAGSVMTAAFKAAGYDSPGAATGFAKKMVANEIKDAWVSASENLQIRPSVHGVNIDVEKASLRTSQEWCHLFGHGDGGSESLDNFVSGSKHCNTEQLAIETAQRAGSPQGLTARITAYLIKAPAFEKAQFTQTDWSFLRQLNPVPFPPDNLDTCRESAAAYVKDPLDQIAKILNPTVGSASVPSLKAYKSASADIQARYRKQLLQRLMTAVYLAPPLAEVIRYKIYVSAPMGSPTKIFDHCFWAQKENFDLNEFNILYWTVRARIAAALNTTADLEALLKSKDSVQTFIESLE